MSSLVYVRYVYVIRYVACVSLQTRNVPVNVTSLLPSARSSTTDERIFRENLCWFISPKYFDTFQLRLKSSKNYNGRLR
jgi:hypothetical protein